MRARLIPVAAAAAATFIIISGTAFSQDLPRVPGRQPSLAEMQAIGPSKRIIVKFKEGTGVRIRANGVQGLSGRDLDDLAGILADAGVAVGDVRRLHARSEAKIDADRVEIARSSRRQIADLNLYYVVPLADGADAAAIAERLSKLAVVEYAEPERKPSPLPVDISPPTPKLTQFQGYRKDGEGVGVLGKGVQGGDGKGISAVDVEYNWVLNHEDLELPASANIDDQPLVDPFPSDQGNHGTAVLGEIVSKKNNYGVEGLAKGAKMMVAPSNTTLGFSVARAIGIATDKLRKGDVILLEQQAPVCGGACGSDQVGCGPVEFFQAEFDAISEATAKGVIVVEAAGNGRVDLDGPACLGRFDRNTRDSGAIIVGAGSPTTRAKLDFSTYGSRVDVQGWGTAITTTGYGDAFNPGDVLQRYTHFFGGTSGASPIITGVVLQVQGALKGAGLKLASPSEIRKALLKGARPQPPNTTPIGPLPRTEKALGWMLRKRGAVDSIDAADSHVAAAAE